MIKKELSITELFGILSVVALSISVISNAFFYYSLDALWVMSILSPTFYVFEIIKVATITASAILAVGGLMNLYKFLLKKSRLLRPKVRYKIHANSDNLALKMSLRCAEKNLLFGRLFL